MSAHSKAGDFPNKSVVEYATIKVEIPHRLVPINLRNEHYEDADLVKGLSVSPIWRLSTKRCTWTAKSWPKNLRRD
ncbi:hypothetical protein ALP47_200117 [Pseudomonas savastanoi]|nr:hypothetical protein ALP47_200117 [Pseudomonas savastanoi]